MRRRHLLARGGHGCAAAASHAQEHGESLAHIDDLGALLDAVRTTRRPLLLFFSTPGCPYCREVRRNYLAPRVADGVEASGVVIREVDITSRRAVRRTRRAAHDRGGARAALRRAHGAGHPARRWRERNRSSSRSSGSIARGSSRRVCRGRSTRRAARLPRASALVDAAAARRPTPGTSAAAPGRCRSRPSTGSAPRASSGGR